ncbi:chloride channel [Phlyctochytrium arcticum]|nr:chloride channel [Phlyctochytrium arcticum]
MSPLPAANIHSSKNPQYRSSEPSPRFRSISWNPFTLSRKTKFPHLLNDQPSSRSYGAIPPADFIARPTSPTRQSHERPHWRKSFIFSKRKSGDYDEEGSADDYVAGSGMRVWYEDYTTIDWIHDTVKERIRLRSLRSIPGVKGWWINHIDAAEAWVLLAMIGIACGCIASFVEVVYSLLWDLRSGYCATGVHKNIRRCCVQAPKKPHTDLCADWTTWPEAFNLNPISPYAVYTPYAMYIATSIFLATSSALVVKLSRTFPVASTSSTSAENAEPAWVTTARERRGLRRSPSKENDMRQEKKLKYHAAGSGIPEVKTILGGFVIRGFLGFRTLTVKTIALILAISSGLVVGAQGPLVHICCAVGNVLSRMFTKYARNEGKRREILSAASAAGVAVAFAAPLGGVLFALEEISYYFPLKTMWRSFFCALIAAATVRLINPIGGGRIVLFQVDWQGADTMGGVWRIWEIFPFALVGILGGLYGAFFIRITAFWASVRNRTWLGNWPVLEVIIIAFLTAAVSFFFDLTRIANGELVRQLFVQCTEDTADLLLCRQNSLSAIVETLMVALIIKLLFTVITFDLKIAAGIFIPSMTIGALMGRMVGVCVQLMVEDNSTLWARCDKRGNGDESISCVVPGIYAVVGAAAAVTGVTRMTVSLTVIILELTGSVPSLLPAMTCIMLAKWVGDALAPMGLYETAIFHGGYPYLDAKRGVRQRGTKGWTVLDIVETAGIGTLGKGVSRNLGVVRSDDGGFPVVDRHDVLVGYIANPELLHALNLARSSSNNEWPVIFKRPRPTASNTPPTSAPPFLSNLIQSPTRGPVSPTFIASLPNSSRSSLARERPSQINSTITGEAHDFTPWMDTAPLAVSHTTSLDLVHELFVKLGVKTLCVVCDGKLVGVVHKKTVVAFVREVGKGMWE